MVRKWLLVLLAALLLPCAALAEAQIIDNAQLFSPSEESRISQLMAEIEAEHQIDLFVLTTYDTPDDYTDSMYLVRNYADDWYDQHGLGMGEDNAGMLILIDMNNRIIWLSSGGVMIDYITDAREESILDAAYAELQSADYGSGVLAAIREIGRWMDRGREEGSFRYDEATGERLTGLYNTLTGVEALVALAAGAGVMLVMVFSVKGSYSLSGSTYRYDLAANSALNMTRDDENYLRQTVTRAARSTSSGSSGGSGRSSGGSGVHRSSGGVSHGGGGRRF